MADLAFLDAVEQARLIREREVSPIELTELYLRRAEKLDPEINSYVTLASDRALDAARAAESTLAQGGDLPPFLGVPISIKDLQETAGIRTTFSCKKLADYVPTIDSAVVRRIKAAGFIVLGKTNTPEFGTPPVTESELNGICRNPWDTSRTPGGSSGGAAAGLAAGLAPIAQGSDGGGSIRIPSSCCGLFGIKPARGRVSLAPRLGDALNGLSTPGPIARTVRDAAALLDVMQGYETGDPYWAPPPQRPFAEEVGVDPGRLRIAFTTSTPNEVPIAPDCVAAVEDAARLLGSLGHDVEERAPAWDVPELASWFITVWAAGASYHDDFVDDEDLEPMNRALAVKAREQSSIDYCKAVMHLQALSRVMVALWDDVDLLLTPTLAMPPVPAGWLFEPEDPWEQLVRAGDFVPFTPPFNVTGQPAVSIPLYWSDEGLPIGVQLAGRPAGEAELIRISAQLEEARPWSDRRPPLS